MRKLITDRQFEHAYLQQRTVGVRGRTGDAELLIGSIDGFNPITVTVGQTRFMRDGFEFVMLDE